MARRDHRPASRRSNDADDRMIFEALKLPGVWLITPEVHSDDRGVFLRHFCAREFEERGIAATVAQGNVSENPRVATLRGFHYQAPPQREAKTLSCLSGAVYDIVVDLRPTSPTFMQWLSVEFCARPSQPARSRRLRQCLVDDRGRHRGALLHERLLHACGGSRTAL